MKFRSPTEAPVTLTLLSGHSTTVTREWRELDLIFHDEAFARRCESDTSGVHTPEAPQVKAGPDAQNQLADVDAHIRQAILAMLERKQEGDFTNDGLPNVKVLNAVAGFRITKEDAHRVYRALVAEAEAAAPDAGDDADADASEAASDTGGGQ